MSSAAQVLKNEREWDPSKPILSDYSREFVRSAMPDVPGMFVDGRIPFGVWSHSAPPGGYKSAIAHQFAVAIADGTPLPGLDWEFTQRGDVLIISPDETFFEQQDREFRYQPFGSLDTDGDQPGVLLPIEQATIHYRQPHGATMQERIDWLFLTMADIEATHGRKIVMVEWDTAGNLIGHDDAKNAYDHVNGTMQALNHRLANEQRLMLITRHIGKDGTSIGSVGINANCNLNTVTKMKPGELSGTLEVDGKVRGAAHWSVAVEFDNGLGDKFTDENPKVVGRSKSGGQARKVLHFLAQAPASVGEIELGCDLSNRQVWRVLTECRRAGEVEKAPGGVWQLVDHGGTAGPADKTLIRWEENGKVFGTCTVCYRRMMVVEDGQTTHPGCDPQPAAEPPAEPAALSDDAREQITRQLDEKYAAATDEQLDALDEAGYVPGPDAEVFKAFRSLEDSIRASRKHPVPLIGRDKRDTEPWTLITERMSGEHKHRTEAPADSTITVLDRRGSYPSAMSNVPVSANLLSRTGPIGTVDKTRAGIYQIRAFHWDNDRIGHPLGKISQDPEDLWWITTPHMRLLETLAGAGHIDTVPILDSWTGLTATNLFEGFYKDVREARKATVDDEPARAEVKRMSSVAIRALWLKNEKLRSPFWRPDWSVSVRAEASVRHWMRAWQAVQAGAQLVGLRQVDEAAFVIPDGVPMTSWVPAPYKVGENYGEVSVKSLATAEEWNGARR
jgi:hypothetical protein